MLVRTLMYHALESATVSGQVPKLGDQVYVLPKADFEFQMKLLKSDVFSVVDPVESNLGGPPGQEVERPNDTRRRIGVRLTFDDGHITNYSVAYPILLNFGYKAVFFLTTNWLNTNHGLTTRMVSELAGDGMVIGSHGVSHSFLTDLSEIEILHELEYSRKVLEDIIGMRIEYLSAPGGRINNKVIRLAIKAGYKGIFLSDPNPTPSFDTIRLYGRLAVKRHYSREQVRHMLIAGNPPESRVFLQCVSLAKKILGNTAYQKARECILRFKGEKLP